MDAKVYLPQVNWSAVVRSVRTISSTTYQITVVPTNANDIGAGLKEVGYYLEDFAGSVYTISAINVDGNPDRIEVIDDFATGYCPQINQSARIYKSIGDGESEYISPDQSRLDKSARDKHEAVRLDIAWKHRGVKIGADENVTNVELGNNMSSEESVSPGWKGGITKKVGIKLTGTAGNVLIKGANGEIITSDKSPVGTLPVDEQLIGAVNGVNRIFSTSVPYGSGTITVFVNGVKERNFTELSDTQIQLAEALRNTGFTDLIEAIYIKKQS